MLPFQGFGSGSDEEYNGSPINGVMTGGDGKKMTFGEGFGLR